MTGWIIVTLADAGYASLADGMIASVRSHPEGRDVAIGLLDGGLDPEQRRRYLDSGILVHEPDWSFAINDHREPPKRFMKALTALPFLPRYFPGYEIYLYIDSDAWVQDWAVVELYRCSAHDIGFAITPELDRSYPTVYGTTPVVHWHYQNMLNFFAEKTARRLMYLPTLNSGVFCARADAPHWQRWAGLLGQIYSSTKETHFFSVQAALNAVIHLMNPPTALLPAWCNWLCHAALPMCSDDGIVLHEPQPPYRRLGIVHLTADRKHGIWDLKDRRGASHQRSLRFGGREPAP